MKLFFIKRNFSISSRLEKYATNQQKVQLIKRRKNELMKGPVYEGMNSFNTDYTKKVRTEEEIEIMELNKFKPT